MLDVTRDARYDILFEPVKIGPVTAKNRFYQVPHCTGSGWQRPRILAGLREAKAEGGWAVVNTEYCSVHPSSDDTPFPSASLWDAGDIKAHALMTDKVHAHGALAGVELFHGGARMWNGFTREVPLGPISMPTAGGHPYQSRAMDLEDIKEMRRWHRNAALRAKEAGFDLVYIYATHGYLLSQFQSPTSNTRTDQYGGPVENRLRLTREIIEDTKDAVGDTMAIAVRFSAETNGGYDGGDGNPMPGETEEMFGLIGELPDLWDININDYSYEMGVSRFVQEGALEPYVTAIRRLTSKPIVSVGRFTSPDTMARQVKQGVMDFIGAARPSIADPFLPQKIEEGRLEDIRECIGCNICYSGDGLGVPIRCTQNPTMSDEWRRGWHPEYYKARRSDTQVLVVGAGPAGLEAAHVLGKRGYSVMLAEATRDLGGRVTKEARLPGLSAWIRVRDYRLQQLEKLPTVEIFRESRLSADDVLDVGADHIAIATGARWAADGFGMWNPLGIEGLEHERIFTPDDIMAGRMPEGRVVIFDDDHYYMATVLAELLRSNGQEVVFATAEDRMAEFSSYTVERTRAQTKLMGLGVELCLAHNLSGFNGETAKFTCEYTETVRDIQADSLVMVTARRPDDALHINLAERLADLDDARPSLARIGDCNAPALIAAAVYAGHKYGRELDEELDRDNPMKHDRVFFEDA